MTRSHASQYAKPGDIYAHARCVRCRHLRYADERPGDPCRVCDCSDHRTPAEVEEVAEHAASPQDAA